MQDNNTTSNKNENNVQEIMELVDDVCDSYHSDGFHHTLDSAKTADNLRYKLKSKLRELVENKFSVQKPLSDECVETLIEKHSPPIHPDFSEDDDFEELVRAVECVHGITQEKQG